MNKSRLIQLIHIAKKQLCLDDETYRKILCDLTGIASCKSMNIDQLDTVLQHMKSKGFKPIGKNKNLSPKTRDKKKKTPLDKLRQQWIEMSRFGFIRDSSEQALLAWSKQQAKRMNKNIPIDRLEWLKPEMTYVLIEQLKMWFKRCMKWEVQERMTKLDQLNEKDRKEAELMLAECRVNIDQCSMKELKESCHYLRQLFDRYIKEGIHVR